MRIGLYGGSFDPIHIGHLLVAQAACEELALDRIYFILAAQSPFKPDRVPAPATARLQMLRLALAGRPQFEVDDQEVKRGGTSYTIDTAREYHAKFPTATLFYLIGADHVATLPKWRESIELARLLRFVIIPRPGDAMTEVPSPFQAHQLRGFPLGVSSSQIRQRVKEKLPIDLLVKPAVAEAIRNNGLYL